VFVEADEDLMPDLSVVRISMIRDVHYDSIDLKVLVYGQENGEEDAPVGEFRVDPEVVVADGALAEGGINIPTCRYLQQECFGSVFSAGYTDSVAL
jgi:hypothetical protein